MTETGKLLKYFGTAEGIRTTRQVVVGDFAYQLGAESVRNITWRGHEVIRAITWPVRDPDWVTLQPTIIEEIVEQAANSDHYRLHFEVGNGALECRVSVQCHAVGELRVTMDMQASTDFATNRAGFTVLHPIKDVAGSDLQVTHADGSVEDTSFPQLISPGQPVIDIVGLRHELHEIGIDIQFKGEVFEMEDQRNWSDASYKTYCVPLVYPFTYTLARGESVHQAILVKVSGGKTSSKIDVKPAGLTLHYLKQAAPQIGLAIEQDWAGTPHTQKLVSLCNVQFLLARFDAGDPAACLDLLTQWPDLSGIDLDLEVILSDTLPATALAQLAAELNESGIHPSHLIALPELYMASCQPSGPWPEGQTPDEAQQAARHAFPDTAIGAGMLTNFTEFNRCRPDTTHCDYVTFGSTAIVHAADDQSVMETLEALPQIFTSARVLSGTRPCRLGLVSIAGRTNPYGSAPADNQAQIRQPLAQVDPRQRGLFAAAWAVGVLGATTGQSIEAITLAAPAGPFGIVWQKQDYPQPGFDDDADAVVYPLFHVVRAACVMSAYPAVRVDDLPAGVVAYGVNADDEVRVLLANTQTQASTVSFAQTWQVRTLDTLSHAAAVSDPLWADTSPALSSDSITLAPYATAFLTLPRQDI